MELTYRQEGDYLLPNLEVPESPKIGKYGMLLRGTLNRHLEETDRQATEMVEILTSRMAQQEGVDERLKASQQMLWVQRMNNIRERAEEIVLNDLIYA